MKATDQIKRAALNKAIDYLLENPERNVAKIMDMIDKVAPDDVFPTQCAAFHQAIDDESNWYQLIMKILTDMNPQVRDRLIKTFVVDANMLAWPKQEAMRDQYHCNIPWAILLDPTSACNLHCTGCWAAEYGNKLNLSFDEIDDIIRQGKELGVYMYIYTGGEPLVRKKDLIRLCQYRQTAAADLKRSAAALTFLWGSQIRATPVSRAACATAFATAGPTRGSNAAGMMYSAVSSSSPINSASARAAASFISSLISLARTSNAPRKMPGKASTLLIWLG